MGARVCVYGNCVTVDLLISIHSCLHDACGVSMFVLHLCDDH